MRALHYRVAAVLVVLLASLPTVPALARTADVTAASADTSADLDNDGHLENIRLTWFQNVNPGYGFEHVVIDIEGHLLADRGEGMTPSIYIVDIDSTDNRREIAVTEGGPSDDDATHFYDYHLGTIRVLGTLPDHIIGRPNVDGSGVISTTCRGAILQTWWHPCRYALTTDTPAFQAVPEPYYRMDTPVVLKVDLPLVKKPWDDEPAGVIRSGEPARILRTDDAAWCEIQSSGGTVGWFSVVRFGFVPVVGKHSTEVFDGISMAD